MTARSDFDFYDELGVSVDASPEAIKSAYRSRMRRAHPDRRPKSEAHQAHAETVRLTEAYDTLSAPAKRATYDRERRQSSGGRGSGSGTTGAGRQYYEPPPRPPRTVIVEPDVVDFGTIYCGFRTDNRRVTVRFSDGSMIRQVRVIDHHGRFWTNEQYAVREGMYSFVVLICGREVPTDLEPGPVTDWLHVHLDEATATVTLKGTVQVPPTPARLRWRPPTVSSRLALILLLVLGVILGATSVVERIGHRTAPAPVTWGPISPTSSGKYCTVTSSDGQVLSYYLNEPGVAKQAAAGKDPIWSVMVPSADDPYLTWWTPTFPYWERANSRYGFTTDYQTFYKLFQYVEVLPVWEDPWQPLTTVFQEFPDLTGGPAAEAAQRELFITGWSKELDSTQCA